MTKRKHAGSNECLNQQSPVKLYKRDSIYVNWPKRFLSIDYRDAPFIGKFEGEPGHANFVLKKTRAGKHRPIISVGDIRAELVKIHLHTPSEHDLEGNDQDGEIHLIHEIKNPRNASRLFVLGVFFDQQATPLKSDFFTVWAEHLMARKAVGGECDSEVSIDPRLLLPKTDKWFRYEGSLTSEPYSETVSWLVFVNSLGIESAELRKLKKHAHQPERGPQEINRRFILRNFR